MSFFGRGDAPAITDRHTTYVTDNLPPVLSIDGLDRSSYEETELLDPALRAVGAASFFIGVDDSDHGGLGTLADGRVEAFFARYLRGEKSVVPTPIELLR